MQTLPTALSALGAYHQFIIYVSKPSVIRAGKVDKFPCDYRTGAVCNAHDPAMWTDAQQAIASAAAFGSSYGVGFAFTDADPFWFLDIDNCLLPDNTWSPLANQLCQHLAGCAVEVSLSGKGLHIFGSGPLPAHGCKNEAYGIELYHTGRFVAFGPNGATGDAGYRCDQAIGGVIAAYFPERVTNSDVAGWSDGPSADWRGPVDDEDLIRRALQSQSTGAAFGKRASFADLWGANVDALSVAYPDDTREYNASQADAALAQHLAFWTGRDCERIERLMQRSALARDKWDRDDYLPRTITNAVNLQFEVLCDKPVESMAQAPTVTPDGALSPTMVTGSTFVSNSDQLELFAGCVYVRDQHRVLVPGGTLLKPEQFKVAFGGYTFTLDTANEKVTRDAWEAFTQSQAYRCPRADSTCFKPNLPPGSIVTKGNQTFANTYWPVDIVRKVGDASPFLDHLKRLIPDDRDRLILLSYMAACVQHQGHKFQWAPLIQGVEGNAKTLLSRYVAEAVGRRYVHWPKATKLAKEFNGWMVGKVFYAVEDIYTANGRQEVIEELKPMITGGDGLEIECKGIDQFSADICGNFIFNSNHQNGVTKTRNDRRFCVFFTAQQTVDDIARDGMGGEYFPNLYNWARAEGYAIVAEYLHTFKIPAEFNPALEVGGLANRAPLTTSTAAAISASAGGVEQEIEEAAAQGLPGFCGGWLSSIQLDNLLGRIGAARRMPHNKRSEMLAAMGYVTHPALVNGRVNNVVLPDGGKPRLFIQKGSLLANITTAAEAARKYEEQNNVGRVNQAFGNHHQPRG